MKTVVTGGTGLVGGEAIDQSIANPQITSIVALVRWEIPRKDQKLKQILMGTDVFLDYPEDVKVDLKDAEACIWLVCPYLIDITTRCRAIGFAQYPGERLLRRVTVEYTHAAGELFAALGQASGKKIRMVYVSGHIVEIDQDKSPWFMADFRRIRVCVPSYVRAVRTLKQSTRVWENLSSSISQTLTFET